MKLPRSALGEALSRPSEIGRMLDELRRRTILPAATAYEAAQRSTAGARALVEFSSSVGRTFPSLFERKSHV